MIGPCGASRRKKEETMGERRSRESGRRVGLVALLALVGLAVGAGIGYATIPDGGGVFHACVKANGGGRLIDPGEPGRTGSCKAKEAAVTWNQVGPTGATGATGPTGAAGLSGLQTITLASLSNSVSPKEAAVLCPAGKMAISGGASILGGSVAAGSDLAATVALKASRPLTISGSDAWTARAEEITPGFDGNWMLTIYAICANVAA